MPAKLVDRFTTKLMDCMTTKHVDHSTAKLMNHLTAMLVNRLTAKHMDRLTSKLMVVNLVKLHLTKLKMSVNTVTLKALVLHSDAESITSNFLFTLLKLYSVMGLVNLSMV